MECALERGHVESPAEARAADLVVSGGGPVQLSTNHSRCCAKESGAGPDPGTAGAPAPPRRRQPGPPRRALLRPPARARRPSARRQSRGSSPGPAAAPRRLRASGPRRESRPRARRSYRREPPARRRAGPPRCSLSLAEAANAALQAHLPTYAPSNPLESPLGSRDITRLGSVSKRSGALLQTRGYPRGRPYNRVTTRWPRSASAGAVTGASADGSPAGWERCTCRTTQSRRRTSAPW